MGLQYAGELIAAFIERAGGSVKGKISTGAVPKGLEPVYVHRQSRTLSKILAELLLGSNNYIANQVFLEIGGHRLGGPVSLEKSLQVANEMLAKHGLAESIHLEEGSGISRGNRFTARGLAQLLHLFEPHATLLRRGEGARFKTGTFSGVRTLAGYADTSKPWARALRDRAHKQRRRDALPAAQSHPVGAVDGGAPADLKFPTRHKNPRCPLYPQKRTSTKRHLETSLSSQQQLHHLLRSGSPEQRAATGELDTYSRQ